MVSQGASSRTTFMLILIAALALSAGGCSQHVLQNLDGSESSENPEADVDRLLCTAEQVTLAWDPPPSDISFYKIFYRTHASGSWILIEQIPAVASPEYTLYHAEFGNGNYDFGIVAVGEVDTESQMHTCLDATASPECGWYMCWTR